MNNAEPETVTVALTRHQYELLHTETMSAMEVADHDEDVAMWTALHDALSPSRWRLPVPHVETARVYCLGIVGVTEDAGVRRSFAAVGSKLARLLAERSPKVPPSESQPALASAERPAVPVQLDLFERPTAPTPPAADAPKAARSPWPSTGITEAGHWGSHDGLKWERVEEGKLVVSPDHFLMGWIVSTPAEARRAMRDGVRSASSPGAE